MQGRATRGALAATVLALGLAIGLGAREMRAQEMGAKTGGQAPGAQEGGAQQTGVPPPEFTTEVFGTAPDGVDGRWLTVAHLQLPDERLINVPGYLEIALDAAEPSVTRAYAKLPEAQQKALDAANEANEPWTPTPEDVRAVAAAWDELPPDPQAVATVQSDVFSRDAFDDTITANEGMADARWALRQREQYHAGGNRPTTQVYVLAAAEERDTGWTGPYASVTVAAAPFPIPISFNGTFDMYRLDAGQERGFLARLADLFSGCGR